MATTVASILSRAETLLQDADNIRWTAAELLDWLNEGQVTIVSVKPTANVKTASVQLAAGTRQSLPADGVALLDIARNMGTDGTTAGRAVRITSREMLDAHVPTWHAATASATAKHYTYNAFDPKTFYVYPPQPTASQGYVEITYGYVPAAATADGNIGLDDTYAPALLDYVLYRAYAKDAEFAASGQIAAAYFEKFSAALSGKQSAEIATTPQQGLGPMSPAAPGSDK